VISTGSANQRRRLSTFRKNFHVVSRGRLPKRLNFATKEGNNAQGGETDAGDDEEHPDDKGAEDQQAYDEHDD